MLNNTTSTYSYTPATGTFFAFHFSLLRILYTEEERDIDAEYSTEVQAQHQHASESPRRGQATLGTAILIVLSAGDKHISRTSGNDFVLGRRSIYTVLHQDCGAIASSSDFPKKSYSYE